MELMTSKKARAILSIERRPINIRTFDKIVEAGLLRITACLDNGLRLFLAEDVRALAKALPKKRPPSRHGVVSFLFEKLSHERAKHSKVAQENKEFSKTIAERATRAGEKTEGHGQ